MIRKESASKLCNKCGETCELADGQGNYGLIDVTVTGGYESTPGNGSGALDDLTSYTFSLCEFCLDQMFETFVIPPSMFCRDGGDDDKFRPATQRVRQDSWRTMKREFFLERDRRRLLTRE